MRSSSPSSLSTIALLLLLLAAIVNCVAGDEEGGGEYYKKYFEACQDTDITVEDVSLLCDSPGAYYYGNGKYRDSNSCMLGDKGKVSVYFYIGGDLDGVMPYVTLKVKDDSDANVEEMVLLQDEPLCDVSNLKAQDGQTCPEAGYYYISGSTYLGDKDGSGSPFDAVAELGFKSYPEQAYFDLGGANSLYCPGGSMGKYSYSRMKTTVASSVISFFVTWGTLFIAIASVALFLVFIVRRIRKQNKNVPFEDADEDLLDGNYNQVIVMSSSRSLVDF